MISNNTFLTINLSSDLLASHLPLHSHLSEVCKNGNDNIVVTAERHWVEKKKGTGAIKYLRGHKMLHKCLIIKQLQSPMV